MSKFGLSVIPEHSDNPDSKGEEGTGVEFQLNLAIIFLIVIGLKVNDYRN